MDFSSNARAFLSLDTLGVPNLMEVGSNFQLLRPLGLTGLQESTQESMPINIYTMNFCG